MQACDAPGGKRPLPVPKFRRGSSGAEKELRLDWIPQGTPFAGGQLSEDFPTVTSGMLETLSVMEKKETSLQRKKQ